MDEDLRTYLVRGGSAPARLARELDDDKTVASLSNWSFTQRWAWDELQRLWSVPLHVPARDENRQTTVFRELAQPVGEVAFPLPHVCRPTLNVKTLTVVGFRPLPQTTRIHPALGPRRRAHLSPTRPNRQYTSTGGLILLRFEVGLLQGAE